jgi:hypothetical protein
MTTNKINDGGPAFPFNVPSYSPQSTASYSASFPSVAYQLQPGMSLRDWFAGQALMGLAASQNEGRTANILDGFIGGKLLSESAYMVADAMLKAREAQS